MHKFQIRFADTGYPQKYEKVTSIQMLQQLVYKQYKIEKNNQKLISKKGVIITGTDKLDNENAMKKTFSADPNNPNSMTQVMGMYLFNHKDLLKNHTDENIQNLEEFSLNILKKRHQTCLGLRPKIYELQPLSKKFSTQQLSKINSYNSTLISTANEWHGLTFQLINLGQTSKQTQQCFVQYIQKWENQRKSLYVLGKNLQVLYEQKKQLLRKYTVSLQAAKNRFDPIMKNEERSSYLTSKGKQYRETIEGLTSRINNLSQQLSSIFKKITIYRKNVKSTHIDLEKNIKLIDEYKKKKSKQIERLFSEMKQTYSAFVEGIREKLDRSNDSKLISILAERKNIDRKYLEYRKICSDIIRDMESKFVEMISYYVNHGQMVRTEYRNYHEIFCEVEQNIKSSCLKFQSDLYNLHKGIQQFVKVNESLDAEMSYQSNQVKLQNLQDQEQKRRYLFNTRLSNLQQQIKEVLKEQESIRVKFVEDIFRLDQMYQNQLLINTRVPCIFINYDECSDRQLVGKWKLVSSGVRDKQNKQIFSNIDLQVYTDSRGLDRILKQMEQIKNFQVSLKSQTLNIDTKTKNLQILLQKSADIFHHIYSNKIANLQKQWNQNERNMQDQISRLERQNKQLQNRLYRYSENLNLDIQNRRQIEVEILRLRNEVQMQIDQKLVMQARYGDIIRDYEKRVKQSENVIEQYKKQAQKLKAQKKQIEEKFVDEIKGMENVVIAFEESEKKIKDMKQINNQYKIVMGDQAVRIANLEEELSKMLKNRQLSKEKQIIYEEELKNKCYGDYKQNDISIDKYSDSQISDPVEIRLERKAMKSNQIQLIQREIQKLQMQIEQLKQENQQLKQDNLNLNEEIVKIAMKDVEDIEVQTEKLSQNQQDNSISNFVSEELSVSHINNRQEAIQNTANMIELVHYKNCPEVGQLRMFVPFSPGLYIALKSENKLNHTLPPPLNLTLQTRNYLNIHQNQLFSCESNRNLSYILDMNCLNSKSRQLLTQCSLVVVIKISKVMPGFEGSNKFYVEGEIKGAFGFEDDDLTVRDYTPFIIK